MRLKEMAVDMGAPMKPSAIGLGPHTVLYLLELRMVMYGDDLTKQVIEKDVNRTNYHDDTRGNCE